MVSDLLKIAKIAKNRFYPAETSHTDLDVPIVS